MSVSNSTDISEKTNHKERRAAVFTDEPASANSKLMDFEAKLLAQAGVKAT